MRSSTPRRRVSAILRTLLAASAWTGAAAVCAGESTQPRVLDGRFDDWTNQAPALVDPADAARAPIDIGAVWVADDPAALHLAIELGRQVNLQALDGILHLLIDTDGNAATGETQYGLVGTDVIISFSASHPKSPNRPGRGVGVRRLGVAGAATSTPYDLGVAFAPTAAARRAEIVVPRGSFSGGPDLLTGETCALKFVFVGADGTLLDETDVISHRFGSAAGPTPPAELSKDPLARRQDTLRVVTWNVERGALIKTPEAFARVLRALEPDVLLFQELTSKESAAQIAAWLEEHVPQAPSAEPAGESGGEPSASPSPRSWRVVFGAGGGDLRTAVASRVPLEDAAGLGTVAWHDTKERGGPRDVRFAGGVVEFGGRRVLFASTHLKCCGSIDSEEDLVRLEEVQALRSSLRGFDFGDASAAGRSSGSRVEAFVIGGDFNLVGSFDPLDLLVEGIDRDGTDLGIADALQLDRRTNATWEDPGQPFTPGRLDYIVFTDSTFQAVGAFVFDTRDLLPQHLEAHGLRVADTGDASDHLPVVVDFAWRAARP